MPNSLSRSQMVFFHTGHHLGYSFTLSGPQFAHLSKGYNIFPAYLRRWGPSQNLYLDPLVITIVCVYAHFSNR